MKRQPAIDFWVRQRDDARAEVDRLKTSVADLADEMQDRGHARCLRINCATCEANYFASRLRALLAGDKQ